MLFADVAQNGLIDDACQGESEGGVQTITHIRETLMGEGFEDGTRYCRHTRLGIITVVELASVPTSVLVLQLLCDIGEQGIREVA